MIVQAYETIADAAFGLLRQGLASGDMQGFFAMLADDVTLWFPTLRQPPLAGRPAVEDFFASTLTFFAQGLHIDEVIRRSVGPAHVVYELRVHADRVGQPSYVNRAAVSLDVRGGQISAYREYLGSNGGAN